MSRPARGVHKDASERTRLTNRALFHRLLGIVRAARQAPGGHCCFTPGDFCYRWQTEAARDARPTVRIWTGEGMDRGFAWRSGDDLHLVTLPGAAALHEEMLGWGETGESRQPLRIPVNERSFDLQRLLARHGYRPAEPELIHRVRQLQGIPAPEPLAPGYRITSVESASQLEEWAAVYREAFAPEDMTAGLREWVNQNQLYRPDLDLVACDPGGAVVAFALVWFDGELAGTFEPLGCRPAYRRRGLSRALMNEGLRRLRQLGANQAHVTTVGGRAAANRLYESIGFRVEAISRTWTR